MQTPVSLRLKLAFQRRFSGRGGSRFVSASGVFKGQRAEGHDSAVTVRTYSAPQQPVWGDAPSWVWVPLFAA
jgi:hypothetical protein